MAGETDDAAEKTEPKTEAKAEAEADDDSDLEAEEVAEKPAEDDSDLEEDEDDEEEKPADKDTAKRIDQVKRTDKQLREQRERDFAARESEINGHVEALRKEWEPKIAAAEKFERLASRASIDPVAVLQALGVGEDRYEHVGQVLYTLSRAKDDPKMRTAAAQLMKARELDDEIAQLKQWREEREKADKEREQTTAADREVEAFITSVTKAASDKTPLAKSLLKNDPDGAREELQIVAFRLAKETGTLPDATKVMIAFEKHQRAKLRKLGIDPKSRGAVAALADAETTTETKAKPKAHAVAVRKPAPKPEPAADEPFTREDFVRLAGNYD
jgi:hypothetical protein